MRKLTSRLAGAALEGALISLLVIGLIALPALAAKGGNGGKPSGGGSSTLAMVMVDPADTVANHGDVVTFTVSTTATDRPFVSVKCYQASGLVYSASAGFFDDYPWPWARNFSLASSAWSAGAADCTATLYYTRSTGRHVNLASVDFGVVE